MYIKMGWHKNKDRFNWPEQDSDIYSCRHEKEAKRHASAIVNAVLG